MSSTGYHVGSRDVADGAHSPGAERTALALSARPGACAGAGSHGRAATAPARPILSNGSGNDSLKTPRAVRIVKSGEPIGGRGLGTRHATPGARLVARSSGGPMEGAA